MTFQYIINHLDKPRSWYIVWTGPHAELHTQNELEQKGIVTYVPSAPIRRRWAGRIKEIHIPLLPGCVFVYATDEEVQGMQKQYTVFTPQDMAAFYQNQ